MRRPCLLFDTLDARNQKLSELEMLPVVRAPYADTSADPIAAGPHEGKYFLLIEPEVKPFVEGPFVAYSSSWRESGDMV